MLLILVKEQNFEVSNSNGVNSNIDLIRNEFDEWSFKLQRSKF